MGDASPKEFALLPQWDTPATIGFVEMKELQTVLAPFAKASLELSVTEFPNIWGGVTLMMPLNEAIKMLGIKTMGSMRQAVGYPGLPRDSFYYREYRENREIDGITFNVLYVVTDNRDQVLAIQFVCETPKAGLPVLLEENRLSYNFINFRKRTAKNLKVGVEGRIEEQMGSFASPSQLASETDASRTPDSVILVRSWVARNNTKPLEVAYLYIPTRVAQLVIYSLELNLEKK